MCVCVGVCMQAFERLRVLDVRGCAYLTARGLRHLLRATPMLQRFTATRWAEAASLMDCPALAHLQSLSLGDAEVRCVGVCHACKTKSHMQLPVNGRTSRGLRCVHCGAQANVSKFTFHQSVHGVGDSLAVRTPA